MRIGSCNTNTPVAAYTEFTVQLPTPGVPDKNGNVFTEEAVEELKQQMLDKKNSWWKGTKDILDQGMEKLLDGMSISMEARCAPTAADLLREHEQREEEQRKTILARLVKSVIAKKISETMKLQIDVNAAMMSIGTVLEKIAKSLGIKIPDTVYSLPPPVFIGELGDAPMSFFHPSLGEPHPFEKAVYVGTPKSVENVIEKMWRKAAADAAGKPSREHFAMLLSKNTIEECDEPIIVDGKKLENPKISP